MSERARIARRSPSPPSDAAFNTPLLQFDLIDVRLFVNVADLNSLTRGAERSNMTPPSASLRIKNIEDRLHTRLLLRSNRGVTLTPAGKAFLHYGRLMLVDAQQLQDHLREYAKGTRGQVCLLANTTAVAEFLPDLLVLFLAKHPDVSVSLDERLSPDIVQAVADGTADIGIVDGIAISDGLVTFPYREDRLVLVTPSGHALSARRSVSFAETLDLKHIGLSEGAALSRFTGNAARSLNKAIRADIRVGNFESLCRMVEANVGIGLVHEHAARRYSRDMAIRIVPVSDEWATSALQICVRSLETLPLVARWLVDALIADSKSNEPSEAASASITHACDRTPPGTGTLHPIRPQALRELKATRPRELA